MGRLEQTKNIWVEPKLVVHGDVERITQVQNRVQDKSFGRSDGLLFKSPPTSRFS